MALAAPETAVGDNNLHGAVGSFCQSQYEAVVCGDVGGYIVEPADSIVAFPSAVRLRDGLVGSINNHVLFTPFSFGFSPVKWCQQHLPLSIHLFEHERVGCTAATSPEVDHPDIAQVKRSATVYRHIGLQTCKRYAQLCLTCLQCSDITNTMVGIALIITHSLPETFLVDNK